MKTKTLFYVQTIIIIILVVLLFRCCNDKTNNCNGSNLDDSEIINNFSNSYHNIPIDKVQSLYNNYNNRFVDSIKQIQKRLIPNDTTRDSYLPTQYSIVPLKRLKDYIAFLDVLEEKNKADNSNKVISGVAISFGAYGLNKNNKNIKSERYPLDPVKEGDYRGRLTTYLTPTYYDTNNNRSDINDVSKHIPFYIQYNNDTDKFKGTYMSLYDYLNANNSGEVNANSSISPSEFNTSINSIDNNIQSLTDNDYGDYPPEGFNSNSGRQ